MQETQGSKRISLLASKPPSNANKLKLRIFATDKQTIKRNLEEDCGTAASKCKRPSMHKTTTDDDSEYESDELSDEEFDENDLSGDDEIGSAIEEPTMYVHGEGSGAANNSQHSLWPEIDQTDECEIGDAIEEDVFYVFGEGNGHDCDVGNNDIKPTEASASSTTTAPVIQSKPMFFFGQAGCLKLSPMKSIVTADNSSASNKNDADTVHSQESSSIANETITNDTNSVALDANNDSNQENVANNDKTNANEIDKGISIVDESSALTNEAQNADDKNEMEQIEQINPSSKESLTESEATTNIETTESNAVADIQSENDNSSKNIESNSSVALANISVQEEIIESVRERERERDELLTTTSDVLKTESHLLNDKVKESAITNECQEKKLSECELTCDDVNLVAKDNEHDNENELENETGKIDENSENVKEATRRVENRIDDSKIVPITDVNQTMMDDPAINSAAVEDVPIENETSISSKHVELTDESKQITDDREPEAEKFAVTIESSVDARAIEENVETIIRQSENVSLNVLAKEGNNEDKTESSIEQNVTESNVSESSLSIDESNAIEEIVVKVKTPEPEVPQMVSHTSSESPIKIKIHKSNESSLEASNERIIESINVTKDTSIVAETSVTEFEEINETLPASNKRLEQKPIETFDDQKTAIASVDILSEPFINDLANSEAAEMVATENDIKESSFDDATIDVKSGDQPESSNNTEHVSVAVKEKRKSIDRIEEASECKKICEAKILEKIPQQSVENDLNATAVEEETNEVVSTCEIEAIPKPLDIPESSSKPIELVESNSTIEINQSEKPNVLGELTISSNQEESVNSTETTEQKNNQTEPVEVIVSKNRLCTENRAPNKIEAASIEYSSNKYDDISKKVENSVAETEKEVVEKSGIETQPAISRTTQLRNRKRRISGEKPRHLSESDDNNDSLIDSPLSQNASSDEEVGGKRIKMRPKLQVRRTTRKSVEQKRNIKDTDWSSDENEMPNAKRPTNDVSKTSETIFSSPEKIIPKEKESTSPASPREQDKKAKLKIVDTTSLAQVESKDIQQEIEVKQEVDEESTEHQSEEEQGKILIMKILAFICS